MADSIDTPSDADRLLEKMIKMFGVDPGTAKAILPDLLAGRETKSVACDFGGGGKVYQSPLVASLDSNGDGKLSVFMSKSPFEEVKELKLPERRPTAPGANSRKPRLPGGYKGPR